MIATAPAIILPKSLPIGFSTDALSKLATVIVIFSESVREPSVTWKRISGYVPLWEEDGVQAKVLLAAVKFAPEGRLEAEYVNMSPLGSVAAMMKVSGCVAEMVLLPIAQSTGRLLELPPSPARGCG